MPRRSSSSSFAKVDPAYAKGVSVALARTHLPANSNPVSAWHEAIAAD